LGGSNKKLSFLNAVFAESAVNLTGADSVIYVNVLEHVEDDTRELSLIYDVLPHGGRCFLFVPALMSLYGAFDRRIGHFRRYSKTELEQRCIGAGFNILRSTYFDFLGIIPWFVKYKLLRNDSLGGGAVSLYDKTAVPLASRVERFIGPPIGKNLLVIAEK
jgi:hypothetical protein